MANFLTLNGIDIPVAADQAGRQLLEIGGRSRALDGTYRSSRRATKQELAFTTPPLALADALAYAGLIQGDGHVWTFDSVYSSKGLVNATLVGTAVIALPATPKFGTALKLSGASVASSVSWVTPTASAWTWFGWRSTNDGTAWNHHIVRSDSTKFLNGVTSVAATSWLTASSTGFALADTAAVAVSYNDVVWFPFYVPDSWVATLYGKLTAWPRTPRLEAAGDAIPTTSLSVAGQVGDMKIQQAYSGGSFVTNLHTLSFALSEI